MRPVMHGDVEAAARVLYAVPDRAHAELLARMLREARWADAWRKRTGRMHPLWGDGSLMAAALGHRAMPAQPLRDARYCRCLISVLEALIGGRGAGQPAQDTQTAAAASISSRRGGIGSPQVQHQP